MKTKNVVISLSAFESQVKVGLPMPKHSYGMLAGLCVKPDGLVTEVQNNIITVASPVVDAKIILNRHHWGSPSMFGHIVGGKLVVMKWDRIKVDEMTKEIAESATSHHESYTGSLAAGGRHLDWFGSVDGVKWVDIGPTPSTKEVTNNRPSGWEKTGTTEVSSNDVGLRRWKRYNWIIRRETWDTHHGCGSEVVLYRVRGHKTSSLRRGRRLELHGS